MSFNPLNYPICFEKPQRLTDVTSWHEHIPFAFTIVQMLKPKIFVELGTHKGDSYCAFCQAVNVLGLDTACYAVDTWEGDEHSGLYGSEILEELRTYHDSRYKGFSQLIQSRFEEALDYFSDGSIDLIHIDGCHTYDAIKHDFKAWLPKMSQRGIVLFHDINVHERDFGAWKFWEEVAEHYPCFEFKHGYGLGVLAVGVEVPEEVLAFLNMRGQEVVTATKLYSYLGDKIALVHQLQSRDEQVTELNSTLQARDIQIAELNGALQARDTQITELNGALQARDTQITELNGALQARDTQITELNSALQSRDTQITELTSTLQSRDTQITELNSALQSRDTQIIELTSTLQSRDTQITELTSTLQSRDTQIIELTSTLQSRDTQIIELTSTLQSMQQSIVWRLLMKYHSGFVERMLSHGTGRRKLYDLGIIGLRTIVNEGWKSFWWKYSQHMKQNDYDLWIQTNEPTKKELRMISEECKNFEYKPKISIITPVWNTDERWLRMAIQSVIDQVYSNWELCIAEGGSTNPHVKTILQEYAEKDERIILKFLPKNKGIVGNSNEAISLATGEYIAFLDHDDMLAPFALYGVIKMLNKNTHLDFIYSDEDKIDDNGRRFNPFFKPDWSPDLLLSCGYTNHLGIYRRKIVNQIGMLRERFEYSQDYDMLLRFTEVINKQNIGHISKILYHWRQIPGSTATDPYAKDGKVVMAAKKALQDALDRRKIKGTVLDGKWPSSYRVKREIKGEPLVSIIIPTKDQLQFLKKCIDSINEKTTYENYEVIVVDNNSVNPETLDYLNDLDICVLKYNKTFNFSKINNFAARHANGDYLIFLNNDIEVISPNWIQTMLEHAQRSEVGAVGCKLLYPDKSIQHTGVILGLSPDPVTGVAGHIYRGLHYGDIGYFGLLDTIRNYSAVTAAAMMVRTTHFIEVGGFNEDLAVCYNDVDFCLRLRDKGYLIVYTPYAELYHYESVSRGHEINVNEAHYMLKKWGDNIKSDPYYNSNLSLRT